MRLWTENLPHDHGAWLLSKALRSPVAATELGRA